MALAEIPLTAQPQAFAIALGGTEYRMRLTYLATREGGWLLDIGDAGGVPLVCGIALVTGLDLLAQYAHLGISGRLWVISAGDPTHVPAFNELGTVSKLYFESA